MSGSFTTKVPARPAAPPGMTAIGVRLAGRLDPVALTGFTKTASASVPRAGVLPYRWAAVGLPPGLVVSADGAFLLNSSCCSPQAAGTYPVVVTVTDSESPIS